MKLRPAGLRLAAALAALAIALIFAPPGSASTRSSAGRAHHATGWVNAWQASPVPGGTIPGSSCPADTGLDNQTVRNIAFTTAGGNQVRVRLTNAFGAQPLRVGAASVAIAGPGSAALP